MDNVILGKTGIKVNKTDSEHCRSSVSRKKTLYIYFRKRSITALIILTLRGLILTVKRRSEQRLSIQERRSSSAQRHRQRRQKDSGRIWRRA